MIPPPAPARPLISASDIFPCLYSPISAPLPFPASPAGGSQRRAEQNWTPRRPHSGLLPPPAARCPWIVGDGSEDGAWAWAWAWRAEWRTRLDSARRGAPRGPVSRAFLFVKLYFYVRYINSTGELKSEPARHTGRFKTQLAIRTRFFNGSSFSLDFQVQPPKNSA